MAIDRLDERLDAIVAPDARLERVVDGLATGEGPVWMGEERRLVFTDVGVAPTADKWEHIHDGRLLAWSAAKGVEVLREPTGRMVGMGRMGDGLVCCEGGGRVLSRLGPDGTRTLLADQWNGHGFSNPNDVAIHSDGSIYFTDSGAKPAERPFHGVYRVATDGDVRLVARDFQLVNGLVFSPDENILYVNDSHGLFACKSFFLGVGSINAYDVRPDGSLANGRVFAELRGAAPGVPDGMKVDQAGNVYCTGPGGIWIIDPVGRHLGTIVTEIDGEMQHATNLAWGGEAGDRLYITTCTSLLSLPMRTRGNKVPGARSFR